jgi:hypothetical protein
MQLKAFIELSAWIAFKLFREAVESNGCQTVQRNTFQRRDISAQGRFSAVFLFHKKIMIQLLYIK